MSIIEYFETLNDSEIIAMFKGKSIKVKYKNYKRGLANGRDRKRITKLFK